MRSMSPADDGAGATRLLIDKLVSNIQTLSSKHELINTRLAVLGGDGMKTASIIEVGNVFRTLVSQVSVLYDTVEFKDLVAPYISKRYTEIGEPALIPGTIGSYIFGCYLSDYGMDGQLSKFCTPVCAASIRQPNPSQTNMRCSEKVIWTDGGETPVFVLIEDDPSQSNRGKVFIPWIGSEALFHGLTQGAIDEIQAMGVDRIEIYGQLYNNKYVMLLKETLLGDIPIAERIKIKTIDFVAEKNGGYAGEVISSKNKPDSPTPETPPETGSEEIAAKSTTPGKGEDESMFRKIILEQSHWIVVIGVAIIFFFVLMVMRKKK
jgi:hypothetical protein